jgi:post-segregation antitoxin (ccd killing protein)
MQRLRRRALARVLPIACLASATLGVAVLATASAALAEEEETHVTVRWAPATGPVAAYAVFVNRNGEGFSTTADHVVNETQVTLRVTAGDTLVVHVAARDKYGNQGPCSPDSEPIHVEPIYVGEPAVPLPDVASAPVPDGR